MGPQQKEAKMNCLWSMDQVWKLSLWEKKIMQAEEEEIQALEVAEP